MEVGPLEGRGALSYLIGEGVVPAILFRGDVEDVEVGAQHDVDHQADCRGEGVTR